jgi:dTDP-4-amino-4,6-dideoxygalactose transaminase
MKNLRVPFEKEGLKSAFHIYVVQIDFQSLGKSRKLVMEQLREKGVGTQVHYIPVHHQPYYKKALNIKKNELPKSEEYYEKCLTLPLYPRMNNQDVDRVIKAVIDIIG